MVAGPGSFDSLVNALPGVVAKRGAHGRVLLRRRRTGRGRRAQGRGRLVRGDGDRGAAAARGGRRPVGEAFDPWRERAVGDGDGDPVGHWASTLLL